MEAIYEINLKIAPLQLNKSQYLSRIEGSPPKCLVSEHLMEAGTGRFEYKSDLVRKRIEQEMNMKKVFASLSKKQKKLLVTSHKKWLLP